MLTVIINNESIHKAYHKSNRIISKYILQVGQKSFAGSISKEGLNALYKELKDISSKYMSICCLLLKNKHNHELLWILGNKDNFDHDTGVFAMKTSAKKLKINEYIENENQKYYNNIIKLSALCHDIGKYNEDFQEKITKIIQQKELKTHAEFFRHEAISAFIIFDFFNKLNATTIDEDKAKEIFNIIYQEYNSDAKLSFDEIKKKYLKKLDLVLKCLSELDNEKNFLKLTFSSIIFLILTHHKLISYAKGFDSKNLDYVDYFKSKNEQKYSIYFNDLENLTNKEKEIKIKNNISFKKDFSHENKTWIQSFCELLNDIISHKLENINNKFHVTMVTHYCRLNLVCSDYIASALKTKKNNHSVHKYAFANIHQLDYGDTVTQHLNKVKNISRKISHIHHHEMNNQSLFPKIPKNETKKLNEMVVQNNNIAFSWQNDAYAFISNKHKNDNKAFTVIISETGSGKTIGGAKIMKALQFGNLRYNLCLGLRTLTLQSGLSYKESLDLKDDQVCTIIGSQISQKIFNQYKNTGSEVLDSDNEEYITIGELNTEWYHLIKSKNDLLDVNSAFEKNLSKIITTPIVVSTIDQMMGLTNLTKATSSKLLLRVISSDILLDEIDNYSQTDLIHVGKLIFMFGLFGRKVTIMSATVSKVIIEKLYLAYKKGISYYNNMMQKKSNIDCFFISNLNDPEHFEDNFEVPLNNIDYIKKLNEFTNFFIDVQDKKSHKLKIANIINTNEWKNNIYKECESMHQKWSIKYQENDLTYHISVGFVKFNRVYHARDFSKYLLTESPERLNLNDSYKMVTLCYHSKYSLIELDNIEKELSQIITRKKSDAEFFKNKKIQELIQLNFKDNSIKNRHLMIIIPTTSIIEVGRDHDYDYCIVEPTSNKSLIQTAGRVLRHRENHETQARCSILSEMIDKEKNVKKMWSTPGVFDYIDMNDVKDFSNINNCLNYETMFDANDYSNKIYSSIMFKENDKNMMKCLEDKSYQLNLKHLNNYIEHNKFLTAYYYNNEYFRKKSGSNELFVKYNDIFYDRNKKNLYFYNNEIYYSDDLEKKFIQCKQKEMNFFPERIFLKNYKIEDLLKLYKNFSDLEINNMLLYKLEIYDDKHKQTMNYHPLLGYNYK